MDHSYTEVSVWLVSCTSCKELVTTTSQSGFCIRYTWITKLPSQRYTSDVFTIRSFNALTGLAKVSLNTAFDTQRHLVIELYNRV